MAEAVSSTVPDVKPPTSEELEDVRRVAALYKVVSNPWRLAILRWLMDPRAHFPPQRDGDLVEDGVCVGFITRKCGLSQPTTTEHMQALAKAGLVNSKKIKNWVFYKPHAERVAALLNGTLSSTGPV